MTAVEEVEVRCPVPQQLPGGHSRPGKLLLKLLVSGESPSYVHPDNLIELACDECRSNLRRRGVSVSRVLHRFDLSGSLIETLVDEKSVLTSVSRVYVRVPVEERFWKQVDRRGYGECWLFTGEARMGSKNQYGSFGLNPGELECGGKRGPRLAHRVAFRLAQGRWPDPYALHGCDTPLCCNAVNPKHVHEGTPRQNMNERTERYRSPGQYTPQTEAAVLHMLQEGLAAEEIAEELGIAKNAPARIAFRVLRRYPRIAGLLVTELAGALVETLTDGEVI